MTHIGSGGFPAIEDAASGGEVQERFRGADADRIAQMLWDQCYDWDGSSLDDAAETRNSIYCGQLRVILVDRGRLRTALRHWRDECGKLHAQLDALKARGD